MLPRRFLTLLHTCFSLAIVLVTVATTTVAQEDSNVASLADLQQQWKTINAQLDDTQEQLMSGEGDQEQLRTKYTDLVDDANKLVARIRETALADIKSGGDDQNVAIRALMGILLNEAKGENDLAVLRAGDFLIEQGVDPLWLETAAKSERIPIKAREIFDELLIRQREASDELPRVKLKTTKGDIFIELFENEAPETVGNFVSLIESGFYKDIDFHRVLEGFMAQTGCPQGTGTGGPGYEIECECDRPDTRPHFTGSVSMAHAGKDTGGSQFFLTFDRTSMLDGRHTVFGRVIDGFEVLENLQRSHVSVNRREEPIPDITKDKIISAEVVRKRDHVYRPNKVGVDEPPLEEPKDKKEDVDDSADEADSDAAVKENLPPKPPVTPPESKSDTADKAAAEPGQ